MNKVFYLLQSALLLIVVSIPFSALSANAYPQNYEDVEQVFHDEPYHQFVTWQLVDSSAKVSVDPFGESYLDFELQVALTATDDDLYIPLSLRSSSDDHFGAFVYNLNAQVGGGVSPFTVNSFSKTNTTISTDAENIENHAYIPAGETHNVTIGVNAYPVDENIGNMYNLQLSFIHFVLDKSDFFEDELYMQLIADPATGGQTVATNYVTYNPVATTDVLLDDSSSMSEPDEDAERRALLEQIRDLLMLIIELQTQRISS